MEENLPVVQILDYEPVGQDVLDMLPMSLIKQHLVVPLAMRDGRLTVAAPSSKDIIKPAGISLVTGCPIDLVVAASAEITSFIQKHYKDGNGFSKHFAKKGFNLEVSEEQRTAQEQTIKLVVGGLVPDLINGHAAAAAPDSTDDGLPDSRELDLPSLERFLASGVLPLIDQFALPKTVEEIPEEETKLLTYDDPKYQPEDEIKMPTFEVIQPNNPPIATGDTVTQPNPPQPTTPKEIEPAELADLFSEADKRNASEIVLHMSDVVLSVRYRTGDNWDVDQSTTLTGARFERAVEWLAAKTHFKDVGAVHWGQYQDQAEMLGRTLERQFVYSGEGESALLTIRLKPAEVPVVDPARAGFEGEQLPVFTKMIESKKGMIVFCAEKVSGITPFVRAQVEKMAGAGRHIMAVDFGSGSEWPGVRCFAAKGDASAFEQLVNMAVEHKPDVLIVNVLNSGPVYSAALKAAAERTLVLGVAEALSAAQVVSKMASMNVDPIQVAMGFLGVVAVEPYRSLCEKCRANEPMARVLADRLSIPAGERNAQYYRAAGCAACQNSGYGPTKHVFEVLPIDHLADLYPDQMASLEKSLAAKGFMTFDRVKHAKASHGELALSDLVLKAA